MVEYSEIARRALELFSALGGSEMVKMSSGGMGALHIEHRHIPMLVVVDGDGYSCSDGRAFPDAATAIEFAAAELKRKVVSLQERHGQMLDMVKTLRA